MPGNHVFRRPWREWRRGKPKVAFLLPPAPVPPQTPDFTALGFRRVVSNAGDKKYTFRRPWWAWGGYRGKYVVIRNTGLTLFAGSGSFALGRYAATFAVRFVTAEVSYSVVGQAIAFQPQLLAVCGSFAKTGYGAAFRAQLAVSSGSLTLTGFSSADAMPFSVACGVFALTGQAVNFTTTMNFWTPETGVLGTWAAEAGSRSAWSVTAGPQSSWMQEGSDDNTWVAQIVPGKDWTH